jgi:hypothetical protein
MKYCPRCEQKILGPTFDELCYDCYKAVQTSPPASDADLLDEFAKAALIGQLSHTGWNVTADAARWAYDCADAMMSERARRREE